MSLKQLSHLVTAVWCCVPGEKFDWDRSWPLHLALVELHAESTSKGLQRQLPDALVPGPCDESGIGVPALRAAMAGLVSEHLAAVDSHRRLLLTADGVAAGARVLMRSPADFAVVVQSVAESWSSLCSTAEKNLAAAG